MREELSGIAAAIEQRSLPETAEQLFGRMWDVEDQAFVGQETFIVDFKDAVPTDFSKGFGASIIRLALAFHNTYGGIIVFGVRDDDFAPIGLKAKLDVEAFNDVLTDATGSTIECLCREYRLTGSEHRIQAVLVPRRGVAKPVRLQRKLDKYPAGILWIRDRHSAREATESSLSMLYSDRLDLSRNLLGDLHRSVHESLPPSPATMDEFKLSSRHRAEFKSKLASCYLEEARRARNISRERAVEYFGKSINAYLSALWIGRSVRELDEEQTLRWLSVPALAFIELLGSDVEPFFSMLEGLVEHGHDIHEEGAKVLLNALRRSSAGRDDKARSKLGGLMRRTVQRLGQHAGNIGDMPGFDLLVGALSLAQQRLTPARGARAE